MLKLKKSLIYEQNCYLVPHFTLYKSLLTLVDLLSTKNNIFFLKQTKGIYFLLLRQTDTKSIQCVFSDQDPSFEHDKTQFQKQFPLTTKPLQYYKKSVMLHLR